MLAHFTRRGIILQTPTFNGKNWVLYCGDNVSLVKSLPDKSVDQVLFSPPFSNLYLYSDSDADMGNSADLDEFMRHYSYLLPDLLRVTVPGRVCVVHCKDLPKYANRDDTAGLIDFPGRLIRAHEEAGWSYHSRVTIWKCPVVERERTNNNGLLHGTVLRDRSQLRQGMADFLLIFRRPPGGGILMSDKPVTTDVIPGNGFEDYVGEVGPEDQDKHPSPHCRKSKSKHEYGTSIAIWRRYAEPVWWDINQTDVLNNYRQTGGNGERHICPLQLGLIERAVQIWSNPDEVVLSPFAGIGSEGVRALRMGRRFVGLELKPEYCEIASHNLKVAEEHKRHPTLFDALKEEEDSDPEIETPVCAEE